MFNAYASGAFTIILWFDIKSNINPPWWIAFDILGVLIFGIWAFREYRANKKHIEALRDTIDYHVASDRVYKKFMS